MDAEYFFSNSSTPMTPEYPWYYINRETIIPGVGDHNAALILPIIAYWITSLTYAYIDWADWEWLAQYRVQPASDADKKNLVTKSDVLWTVFKMQAIQSILGWTIYHFRVGDAPPTPNHVAEMQAMAGKIGGWMVNALSEGKAGELMAKYSYQIGYYGYWWAAPAARMLAAMSVLGFLTSVWLSLTFCVYPGLFSTHSNTGLTVVSTLYHSFTNTYTRFIIAFTFPTPLVASTTTPSREALSTLLVLCWVKPLPA